MPQPRMDRRGPKPNAAEHGVAADSPPSLSLGPLSLLARFAAECPTVRHGAGKYAFPIRIYVRELEVRQGFVRGVVVASLSGSGQLSGVSR